MIKALIIGQKLIIKMRIVAGRRKIQPAAFCFVCTLLYLVFSKAITPLVIKIAETGHPIPACLRIGKIPPLFFFLYILIS
jgi:hypothetical protein